MIVFVHPEDFYNVFLHRTCAQKFPIPYNVETYDEDASEWGDKHCDHCGEVIS